MNREGTFLYIEWFDDEGLHSLGPFYTVSPDGNGQAIKQDWFAYIVQSPPLFEFRRITIPQKYHSIVMHNK